MKVDIYLVGKDGTYDANGVYDNGVVIVKKGSKLRMTFAEHIRGGKTAKQYRNDESVVDENGITKKDCTFTSPSTAAQFVTGSSSNGWTSWHVEPKINLRKYIDSCDRD